MRESGLGGVEGEKQIERQEFLKIKAEMVGYLEGELRRVNRFVIADLQSRKNQEERAKYLKDIISDLEKGTLSSAREFFAARKGEKEEAVAGASAVLRRAIEAEPLEIGKLQRKMEEVNKRLEEAKKRGDRAKMAAESGELLSIKTSIAIVESLQEERRKDLEKAQDDPDLERFTKFVAAIDEELTRRVREK